VSDDLAFEIGIVETSAKHVDQVVILSLDAPGGANAIVVELGGFRGAVPSLDGAHKPAKQVVWTIGADKSVIDFPKDVAPSDVVSTTAILARPSLSQMPRGRRPHYHTNRFLLTPAPVTDLTIPIA
jgi:hypothetical protein